MSCQDLQELLSAYADGESGQTQCDFIEEHLAGCTECRAALAQYQEDGRQLTSLRNISHTVSLKKVVMSRVKAAARHRQGRRRLLPAFVGAVSVITMGIIAILMTLPGESPKEVLAKALTNTMSLHSFSFNKTIDVRLPEKEDWLTFSFSSGDYAWPDRHVKSRSDQNFSDGIVDDWTEQEVIVSDNVVYLWKYTMPLPVTIEVESELWDWQASLIEEPMKDFRLLTDIKKMSDEKIDGTHCLHFKGTVDMDAWILNQLELVEPLARDRARKWAEGTGGELTDVEWAEDWAVQKKQIEIRWRTKQVYLEYWIGKEDNLLYQYRYLDTLSPGAKEIMPLSQDTRETIRFFGFNANTVIKPPLNGQGNLLPDWTIQSFPY